MLLVATWINLEIIILSEVSPTEKDKYILLVCGKTMQINLYNRTEIDPQTQETNYGYQRGKQGEG